MGAKKVIDIKQMYYTCMYPLLKLFSKNVKFMFGVKFTLWLDKQNFTKFVLFNKRKRILKLCKKKKEKEKKFKADFILRSSLIPRAWKAC